MPLRELEDRLKAIGGLSDEDLPLLSTLLMLGALDRHVTDLQAYEAHLVELNDALTYEIAANPQGSEPLLPYRLARLRAVITGEFHYKGDLHGYDDPENINLLSVIDRRAGIPVALGALYLGLAEKQGWDAAGLNFPGHFLFHLTDGAQHLIADPFVDHARELTAGDLRQLLKNSLGSKAELHHGYYEPVTKRDVVLRFYNNRKTRLITRGDYDQALETLTHQLWVAPNEPRLYYDAGFLCAKVERLNDAIFYLQEFTQISNDVRSISEARGVLTSLQRLLQ